MSHETLGFAVTNDTIYFFSEVSTGMENGKCSLLPSKKAAFFVDLKQFQHSSFVIHRSYIPEKPIKNLSKKLIKNLTQNHPKSTQNHSWEPPGEALGDSGGGLGYLFDKKSKVSSLVRRISQI